MSVISVMVQSARILHDHNNVQVIKRPVRAFICFHVSSTDRRRIMVSLE